VEIPQDFVIQNIYTYCKRPFYKKNEGVYNAECCICKEGSSSGSKRRLFYFPSERYFYCFNCCQSWSEMKWLTSVTGMQPSEVLKETRDFIPTVKAYEKVKIHDYQQEVKVVVPSIPSDSINILDEEQFEFFKDKKEYELIKCARKYCFERRLFTAINRPKALYVSYGDTVHSGRLIIPFYDENDKIYTYQSRLLESVSKQAKYLTKYGDKCFFGENTIQSNIPYLFITEGPIDAMFLQNGLGIGGAKTTEAQELFLLKHFDKRIIYVYDNDKNNLEMQKTIQRAILKGKHIFVWPREFSKFKDFNEVCCSLKIDKIPTDFIVKNAYTGTEASLKYKLSLLQVG
jgi:hypothetical protein